jgi:hypothetical protein
VRLTNLPGDDVQLTYCTNIHAGETWGGVSASLDEHGQRQNFRVWVGRLIPFRPWLV